MKRFGQHWIIFSFLVSFYLINEAQVPTYFWAEALSGNVEEIQRGTVVDNLGNVYITGVFFGTVDFDPGAGVASITPSPYGSNAYIAKYDINGNYQWAINIPIATSYGNNSIAIDASANIYITGYFAGASVDFNPAAGVTALASASGSNDIYIAKYDINGNLIWAKGIGSTGDDRGNEIIIAAGDILLTGNFNGTVDFDPGAGTSNLTSLGSGDIYIAKYNASGNFIWANQIGGSGTDDVRDIATDNSGNIFITGNFESTADFDPGAGTADLISAGWGDIFIAKYNSSGNYQWAKNIGASGYDCGTAISIDTANNLMITGTYNSTVDFDPGAGVVNYTAALGAGSYIGKFDTNGNYVWVKPLPLNTSNIDIIADDCNNIFISGSYSNIYAVSIDMDPGAGTASLSVPGSLPPPYYNIFAKYDGDGNYLWANVFGRTCYCSVAGYKSSLTIDTSGFIYYSGIFNAPFFGTSTVDFDPGAGTANLVATSGVDNTFFAKYDIGCPLIPLPVTWISFYGENKNNNNYLYWITASELNNDYFEIERSENGNEFIAIGRMQGAGTTVERHNYEFIDDDPTDGINYYRLKQVDGNGDFSLSSTIEIQAGNPDFILYPNPAKNSFYINFSSDKMIAEEITIDFFNTAGKYLFSKFSNSNSVIDISGLQAGVYFVMISNQDHSLTAKVKLIKL